MSLLINILNIKQQTNLVCTLLLLCLGYSCQGFSEDSEDNEDKKPKTLYGTMFNSGLSATATGIVGGVALASGATGVLPSIALGASAGLATFAGSRVIDAVCPDLENPACIKALLTYAGCAIATQSPLNPIMSGFVGFCSALLSNAVVENSCSKANETLKKAIQIAYTASGALVSGAAISLAWGYLSAGFAPEEVAAALIAE